MGVMDRFEKGIERAVNGAFAKAFRSEVAPVEIASALRRESDAKAAPVSRDRVLAPNVYVVELGPADYERLKEMGSALPGELEALVAEHTRAQRYYLSGPVEVSLEEAADLDTGLFRVRSTTEVGASSGPAVPSPHAAAAAAQQPPVAPSKPVPPPPGKINTQLPPPPHGVTTEPVLEMNGQTYPLDKPVTVIGRGTESDIVLDDSGASRRHAEVHLIDGMARIIDLGSTNGTFVNGSKRPVSTLTDGSVITIGRSRITFHAANAAGGAW